MAKKSLAKKTIVLLIIQMALMLTVLVGYIAYSFKTSMESLRQAAGNYLELYCKDLDTRLTNADRVLERIVYDNPDYSLLQSPKEEERFYASVRIKQLLTTSLVFDDYIDFITVGESNYKTFLMVNNVSYPYNLSLEMQDFVLSCASLGRAKAVWSIIDIADNIYVYKMFVWQNKAIGIFISADKFMMVKDLDFDENDTVIVLNCNSTSKQLVKGNSDIISKRNIAFSNDIGNQAFSVTRYISPNVISKQLSTGRFAVLVIIVIAFGYAIMMVKVINKDILVPLTIITSEMKNIQRGFFSLRLHHKFNTKEFDSMQQSFNSMMDEIVNLKISTYEKQLELNQSELKTVKLQIRPHFFLNALTTISSLSHQNNNEDVIKYIESLSDNIRYMFKSGLHTVNLEEELSHVENYFEMQELKYPGCVFFFIESDESLANYQIPQMIIHTIIENEYKYAVSMDSMLSIIIKCYLNEYKGKQCLFIDIEDDGKGYPEEILKDFSEDKTNDNNGNRIGLWSIKRIMNLMYDKDDLFTIANIKPHGCLNRIIVPEKPVHEIKES